MARSITSLGRQHRYLHSDHRGTPGLKTAINGTPVYRSRLQPFGTPYDGIWRDGPGFTKHASDENAQLSYMQQRYYDPETLRFLSPDPIGASAGSFNVYWYANNNPYTFVDPDGRAACESGSMCSHPGIQQHMISVEGGLGTGTTDPDAAAVENSCLFDRILV